MPHSSANEPLVGRASKGGDSLLSPEQQQSVPQEALIRHAKIVVKFVTTVFQNQ